jgi:hypothetical protein
MSTEEAGYLDPKQPLEARVSDLLARMQRDPQGT